MFLIAASLALAAGGILVIHVSRMRPEDRVYRIGADHAPPYYYLHPDGRIEGLAVDVLNAAAQRAHIRLQWVAVRTHVDEAFPAKIVDLWPAIAESPFRRSIGHMTEPWLKNNYCLLELKRTPGTAPPAVLKVYGRPGSTLLDLAARFLPPHKLTVVPSRTESVEALCRGEADAAFVEARFLDSVLLERPKGCETAQFQVRMIEGATSELRVMSTPAAAKAAEALRLAISSMAASGKLAGIVEHWSVIASTDAGSVYALKDAADRNIIFRYTALAALVFIALLAWQVNRARKAEQHARVAQQAAERANTAKTEFLANMSHEIRTPLNGVLGVTNLVLDGPITEEKRPDLEVVQESAQSLLRIIDDILDFSKVEAGKVKIESVAFDLLELLNGIVELFAVQASPSGVALLLEYPGDLGRRFTGDPGRVRQIVANLVSNAVKFTSEGRIVVTVAPAGHQIRITVRDTGIGISHETLARLFSKFTQADASTTRKYGGTGLGLAISRRLAELMAGTIGAQSEPGVGSTFWVQLPLRPAPALAPTGSQPLEPAAAALAGRRVLVAEDNGVNRELLARILRKYGCEVDLAENGVDACRLSEQHDYSMIFMDCQMPVMDGYEATTRIRVREQHLEGVHTPIIAVTAHVLDGEIERCRAAGMDDYMSKPIQAAELYRCIAIYSSTNPTASSANSPAAI